MEFLFIVSQKLMSWRTLFSKLMCSMEPIGPMLTAPLSCVEFVRVMEMDIETETIGSIKCHTIVQDTGRVNTRSKVSFFT